MKRAIIIGATSGIGLETARLLHHDGWTVGLMGRRTERLEEISSALGSQRVFLKTVDTRNNDAGQKLLEIIDAMGGADLILHASGIGSQNISLNPSIEIATGETNVMGFMRMVTAAFNYFAEQGHGHIAIISSIAGTKGLGAAPAYSATKRFQSAYIQSLAQQATMRGLDIRFTDIRPGFVDTDFLNGSYPMLMSPQKVAKLIVKALRKERRKIVIDWRFAILTFFWRLIPDCLWERLNIKN